MSYNAYFKDNQGIVFFPKTLLENIDDFDDKIKNQDTIKGIILENEDTTSFKKKIQTWFDNDRPMQESAQTQNASDIKSMKARNSGFSSWTYDGVSLINGVSNGGNDNNTVMYQIAKISGSNLVKLKFVLTKISSSQKPIAIIPKTIVPKDNVYLPVSCSGKPGTLIIGNDGYLYIDIVGITSTDTVKANSMYSL